MPNHRVAVPIPNHPYIHLPPRLAELLRVIRLAGAGGVNTFQLQQAGFTNISVVISRLRKWGVGISSRCRNVPFIDGTVHRRIAHYEYAGFDPHQYNLQK